MTSIQISASLRGEPTPELPAAFRTGRVLVLGLGGGCDIITAYVVAQNLPGLSRDAIWGNTKRNLDTSCIPYGSRGTAASCGTDDAGEPGAGTTLPGLFTTAEGSKDIESGTNYYGTCGIDAAVPHRRLSSSGVGSSTADVADKAADGPIIAPLILQVPKIDQHRPDARVDESALQQLAKSLRRAGVTAIVGVDAGGDSITGGIDHNGDPSTGTDQLSHRVCLYTGLPYIQIVCGLGCDGESSDSLLRSTLRDLAPKALRHSVSVRTPADQHDDAHALSAVTPPPHTRVTDVDSIVAMLFPMGETWARAFSTIAGPLGVSRTPCIMAHAIMSSLFHVVPSDFTRLESFSRSSMPRDKGWESVVSGPRKGDDLFGPPIGLEYVTVARGLHPSIGLDLLSSYVAIVWRDSEEGSTDADAA